jgi:hypothetical protein
MLLSGSKAAADRTEGLRKRRKEVKRMKTRTNVKAGGLSANHNEKLVRA